MKNTLLWKLSPKKGGPDSYLFGTMHVRDLRAFDSLEQAKRCLEKCAVFASEFDFSETDPYAVAELMKLPENTTLDQLLKPGTWKCLKLYSQKKLAVPVEHMQHLHPMSVSLALTNALLMDEATHSLDETLWEHAKSIGKKTTGVETFDEQLQTLRNIPFEQHLKSLTWLLKNYARQKRRMKKMLIWYQSGDLQRLYKAAKKDAKGMRKELLYKRNKLMAARFADIAGTESLFCAVGAGHLAGQKGLLRLLKKQGFRVRTIAPNALK